MKLATIIASPKWAVVQLVWKPVLAGLVLIGGCTWTHHRGFEAGQAKQAAKDAAAIAGKDKALHAAAIALDGASVALQQQNEENERELLRARQAEADYNTAANVALQAQDAAQKRLQGFDRALQDARAHPSCQALMDVDRMKACGL